MMTGRSHSHREHDFVAVLKDGWKNFHFEQCRFVINQMIVLISILLLSMSKGDMAEKNLFYYPEYQYNSVEIKQFWRNYIRQNRYGCVSENISSGRAYTDYNINISDCFFIRFQSYSLDGGVIFISLNTNSLNVYYSMFFNCLARKGGAIYTTSKNSVIKFICTSQCSCGTSNNHFAYLSASQINNVDYLSMTLCSSTTSGSSPIQLNTGNVIFDNSNSSMNRAAQNSALYIVAPNSFSSSFCTFAHNVLSNRNCIHLSDKSGSLSYANIVHNNSPARGIVYISSNGIYTMYNCVFDKNSDYLFVVFSGSLEICHCLITHLGAFSDLTEVKTNNNNSIINTFSLENRQTYEKAYFNSEYCNADLPNMARTLKETMVKTFAENPINTPVDTPMNTFADTPINTPVDTLMNTPITTVDESNERSMVVVVLTTLSFIAVIVGLVLFFTYIFNLKANSLSSSESSFEKNQSIKNDQGSI